MSREESWWHIDNGLGPGTYTSEQQAVPGIVDFSVVINNCYHLRGGGGGEFTLHHIRAR